MRKGIIFGFITVIMLCGLIACGVKQEEGKSEAPVEPTHSAVDNNEDGTKKSYDFDFDSDDDNPYWGIK